MAPGASFVLSYPKAGRTWLRTMMNCALLAQQGRPHDLAAIADALHGASVSPVVFDHDASSLQDGVPWQKMSPSRERYRGTRVLLLGRDVRDLVVSSYFQATRRVHTFAGGISAFLRDDRSGVDKILTFYRIWDTNRTVPASFDFMRYEDLHADPARFLARALTFFELPVSPSALEAGVAAGRFEVMKEAEVQSLARPAAAVPERIGRAVEDDTESYKVRRGRVGGFRDYLSDEDVAYIDARIAERGCEFTRPVAAAAE